MARDHVVKSDLDKEVKTKSTSKVAGRTAAPFSAKASKSKETKGKKSYDAKLPSKAGVKRAASISAKSSKSSGAKRMKPSNTKLPSKAGVKRAASITAKSSESSGAKRMKLSNSKSTSKVAGRSAAPVSAKLPSKAGVKRAAPISAKSSESSGAKRAKPSNKCSKAIENITIHYPKLTSSFPIDDLLPSLYGKKVINDVQKEGIENKKMRKEKVSFLFDEVIKPELGIGVSTKYNNLIKVMETSDDSTAKHLAVLLKGTKS